MPSALMWPVKRLVDSRSLSIRACIHTEVGTTRQSGKEIVRFADWSKGLSKNRLSVETSTLNLIPIVDNVDKWRWDLNVLYRPITFCASMDDVVLGLNMLALDCRATGGFKTSTLYSIKHPSMGVSSTGKALASRGSSRVTVQTVNGLV